MFTLTNCRLFVWVKLQSRDVLLPPFLSIFSLQLQTSLIHTGRLKSDLFPSAGNLLRCLCACVCQHRARVSGRITQASSYWAPWTKAWEPDQWGPFPPSKWIQVLRKSEPCFSAWCPVCLDTSSERKSTELEGNVPTVHIFYSLFILGPLLLLHKLENTNPKSRSLFKVWLIFYTVHFYSAFYI